MLNRFSWKENEVYFIPVTESVSTVIQLLKKPYIILFNAFSQNSITAWDKVKLQDIQEFRVIRVLHSAVKQTATQKLKDTAIVPTTDVDLPKHFISQDFGNHPDSFSPRFNLVSIDPDTGDLGMGNPIVEADIYPAKSLERLEPYELTALHTAKDLMNRLYWSYSIKFGLDKYKECYLNRIIPIPVDEWEQEYLNAGGYSI
ncbi:MULTISPECIES: hypothetical protein [Paenibacillus]|uniref:hypothetical protein n=1 Tax=Paenibacillus TaxID=44249 RepID=UPI002FDFD7FE